MKAHIVLAHPEPRSFNGHLADLARRTLEQSGWEVSLSDLYAMGFDPCERPEHYDGRRDPERFDVQAEQRHASDRGAIPDVIRGELMRVDRADLVILRYPMWWHLPPAMLKGWFDRLLVYGEVYTGSKRFEQGRFTGAEAILSVTVGTSPETYAHNGRSADIDLLLWPVNFTLAYVGFQVLRPHIAYGVEAGLRYSEPGVVEARLDGVCRDYAARLKAIEQEAPLPFHAMSDWGEDGRIKPSAPVYSPFIRHREHLELS